MRRFYLLLVAILAFRFGFSQTIRTVYHNVNYGNPPSTVNEPGTILYPTGYQTYETYTPVIFVHGFTGTLTGAYEANIEEVKRAGLNAAFVQLEPMGTTEENGMLLRRMISEIRAHFGAATVSIVAHSKGGMDTERALYGKNPYNPSYPSFGFVYVDGVYTFGSPLKGSRVADVGEWLAWTGIGWIAMWYTNAFSLTSSSVQEFHNWARGWRMYGWLQNYTHPYGVYFQRLNMVEDNTTRWWAFQSDDPCYGGRWYFCYVGDYFHRTIGAAYDADFDWSSFSWENWYPENDGFIAVYRAQRNVNTNPYPPLTPFAGDANYLTTRDADHISLWDPGEGHFDREVRPYLHYGLYSSFFARPSTNEGNEPGTKPGEHTMDPASNIYLSNGYVYPLFRGQGEVILENGTGGYGIWIYSPAPVGSITLTNEDTQIRSVAPYKTEFVELANAYVSYYHLKNAAPGIYTLSIDYPEDVIAGIVAEKPSKGFGVKWNWDEYVGYTGEPIEIKIADMAPEALPQTEVKARLSRITRNGAQIPFENVTAVEIPAQLTDPARGIWTVTLPDLEPGEQYAIQVEAVNRGEDLLARTAINTFYVHENIPVKDYIIPAEKTVPDESTGEAIDLYPNPARDVVYIHLPAKTEAQVTIKDLSGKTVLSRTVDGPAELDISALVRGTYLVEIRTSRTSRIQKLIVR